MLNFHLYLIYYPMYYWDIDDGLASGNVIDILKYLFFWRNYSLFFVIRSKAINIGAYIATY